MIFLKNDYTNKGHIAEKKYTVKGLMAQYRRDSFRGFWIHGLILNVLNFESVQIFTKISLADAISSVDIFYFKNIPRIQEGRSIQNFKTLASK